MVNEMIPKQKNESEYLDKIEKFLNYNNFKTWREEIPDQCKNWGNPYRIDLVFYRHDTKYFGVEGKYCNTFRQGAKIAKGFEQLKKYRELTYFNGVKIKKWGLLLEHKEFGNDSIINWENKGIKNFLKYFLNYYDFSLLEFIENRNPKWNRLSINPYTKKSMNIYNNIK